jgi:hypothetical protein
LAIGQTSGEKNHLGSFILFYFIILFSINLIFNLKNLGGEFSHCGDPKKPSVNCNWACFFKNNCKSGHTYLEEKKSHVAIFRQ